MRLDKVIKSTQIYGFRGSVVETIFVMPGTVQSNTFALPVGLSLKNMKHSSKNLVKKLVNISEFQPCTSGGFLHPSLTC